MSNPFHVAECFLGVICYDGHVSHVVKVNQQEWLKCSKAYARVTTHKSGDDGVVGGFVELRQDLNSKLATFVGVNGGSVSFPSNASLPNLFCAFKEEAAAKRWIESFTKR